MIGLRKPRALLLTEFRISLLGDNSGRIVDSSNYDCNIKMGQNGSRRGGGAEPSEPAPVILRHIGPPAGTSFKSTMDLYLNLTWLIRLSGASVGE